MLNMGGQRNAHQGGDGEMHKKHDTQTNKPTHSTFSKDIIWVQKLSKKPIILPIYVVVRFLETLVCIQHFVHQQISKIIILT